MFWLFLTCAFFGMFLLNLLREPRSFWNAFLLLTLICTLLLWLGEEFKMMENILTIFVLSTPIVFEGFAIFLIINGFVMMKKEGKSFQNMLSLWIGIVLIIGSVGTIYAIWGWSSNVIVRNTLFLVLALEFYIVFSFVALLLYSLLYTCIPKRIKCDYIIVHGCGLINGDKVSPLLQGRITKAVSVYNKSKSNPKPQIVVSGGQGSDEKISEAQAMKNYLLENDFPENDIIMEDKSTTTFENLKNVRDMLDTNGKKHSYIFVTNNYHVFRTGLFAKKLKMKAQGVGCRTAGYYWPSAFIREYIAIIYKYKWIMILIFIVWLLALAASYL